MLLKSRACEIKTKTAIFFLCSGCFVGRQIEGSFKRQRCLGEQWL
jgi:hypothetical protein